MSRLSRYTVLVHSYEQSRLGILGRRSTELGAMRHHLDCFAVATRDHRGFEKLCRLWSLSTLSVFLYIWKWPTICAIGSEKTWSTGGLIRHGTMTQFPWVEDSGRESLPLKDPRVPTNQSWTTRRCSGVHQRCRPVRSIPKLGKTTVDSLKSNRTVRRQVVGEGAHLLLLWSNRHILYLTGTPRLTTTVTEAPMMTFRYSLLKVRTIKFVPEAPYWRTIDSSMIAPGGTSKNRFGATILFCRTHDEHRSCSCHILTA